MNYLWNQSFFRFLFYRRFLISIFSGRFPESQTKEIIKTGEKIVLECCHDAIVHFVMSFLEKWVNGWKLVKSIVKSAGAIDRVVVETIVIVVEGRRDSLAIDSRAAGASGWGEAGDAREFHTLYRHGGEWHENEFCEHFKILIIISSNNKKLYPT